MADIKARTTAAPDIGNFEKILKQSGKKMNENFLNSDTKDSAIS